MGGSGGATCPRCGQETLRVVGAICYRCHQEELVRRQEQQEWAARLLKEHRGHISRSLRAVLRRMARREEV